MESFKRGQVVTVRKYDDKKKSWSEIILSESGGLFYIRDYQTSFLNSSSIANLNIIGQIVIFEHERDLVTKVISVKAPETICPCCSQFVKNYENQDSFLAIKENFVKNISVGNILVRERSNSLDIVFDQNKYAFVTNFAFPESYYELQFKVFFCKLCESVFAAVNTERSSLHARFAYEKYPYSAYKP